MSPATIGYLWCALAALASAMATYLIKVSNTGEDGWSLQRLLWLGAACGTYGGGFVAYSLALRKLEMSLAYPVMTGFAMAMVALIGYAALNEPMNLSKVGGMLLIAGGAFALTR
jgi:multidrug transporter EmrE-like cation transporter